jgi:hypothetical protein
MKIKNRLSPGAFAIPGAPVSDPASGPVKFVKISAIHVCFLFYLRSSVSIRG